MYKAFLIAALASVTQVCQAATVGLNWVVPTHRVNGLELNAADISHYIVKYDCGYVSGEERVIGRTTHTLDLIGNCEFWVIAVDTDEIESDDSDREGLILRPSAPDNLRIIR